MGHHAGREIQSPQTFRRWKLGEYSGDLLVEPLCHVHEVLLIHPLDELIGIRHAPSQQGHYAFEAQVEHRGKKRGQDLLQGWVRTRCLQHFEAFPVYGFDPSGDDSINEAVLRLKVIVDGSQIHLSLRRDIAQGRSFEAFHPKEFLRSVEDSRFRIYPWGHTFVSIIRLFLWLVNTNFLVNNGMRTTIDRAGRVVIPKVFREQAGLRPGDEVEVNLREGNIEISQMPPKGRLIKEGTLLVWQPESGAGTVDSVALVEEERERRISEIARRSGL